jgi:hypothetical protein
LNGTVELVLIEVRQAIVSKPPYPGLWCSRAFRKTETNSSVVPSAISWTIWVHGDFRPHPAEIDIREVAIGVSGKVSGALTGLSVDVVYLREAKFMREQIKPGRQRGLT